MSRNQVLGLMVIVLLVAAALRFPALITTPPPIHYDEAANGVLVQEIAFEGYRPVFIPSYTGKDVLFFYLAGTITRLGGSSIFTMRYTSALVGVLTVAATYWLSRELIRKRTVAVFAAALLTVTFWHLIFSRLGFRAITEPLLQALTVAAIWRGLRRDEFRWLTLGGICLGLTGYTYLAARLFPMPLALALLPTLLQRSAWKQRLEQLGYTIALAFLTLIPLLLYFYRNPDAFLVRILQVAPTTERQLTVGQSFLKALGMYFLEGDPYERFNLPGLPVFNWVWGGFLLAGTVYTLLQLWRARHDWQRGGWLLLLLMPLLMLLPTALATGEIVPSNIRAIGVLPFVMLLPALGVDWLLHDVLDHRYRRWFAAATTLTVLLTLTVQGGITARTYFNQWAHRPDLFYASDGDLAAAAAWLDEYDTTNTTIYMAALHYRHPTTAFLSQKYEQINWLPNSAAIAWPESGPALVIYPRSSPTPHWLIPYLSSATVISGTNGPDGQPAFMAYEWAIPPTPTLSQPTSANFAHLITLQGYDVGEDAAANESLSLTLHWHIENQPQGDYASFVHLEDAWGYRWSQVEQLAFPTAQWQPGTTLLQHIALPIPAGIPPGSYRLQVGFFTPDSQERLAVLDTVGRFAGTTATLENITIAAGEMPEARPQPPHILNGTILSQLTLLGYESLPTQVETGAPLTVSLWWQATYPLPPLSLRFELFRPDGFGKILRNTLPVHATLPFPEWPAPIFLKDHQTVYIPPDLPAGQYSLHVRVLGTGGESLYSHKLADLTIIATERLFELPEVTTAINANFGDELTLVGYDLAVAETEAQLTLIWQARRIPTADYAVFVHLLDPDGICCVWQSDQSPRQGSYPVTRWLAGEVVIDEYTIPLTDLTAGSYPIELGLYLPQTGQRLLATLPDGSTNDAIQIISLIIAQD